MEAAAHLSEFSCHVINKFFLFFYRFIIVIIICWIFLFNYEKKHLFSTLGILTITIKQIYFPYICGI